MGGASHAARNDRPRQDGRQHGATAPPGGARVRGVRHVARRRRGAGARAGDRRRLAAGAGAQAAEAARRLDHGPGGGGRPDHRRAGPAPRARRHPRRRRQLVLRRRPPPRARARAEGDPLRRRGHERRRVGAGPRLLPDDRRRGGGGEAPRSRSSRRWPPTIASAPPTPGREGRGGTAEHGYLHCGPSGAGHFVKMVHNGIEYGLMAAYAEGLNILRGASVGKRRARGGRRDHAAPRSGALPVRASTWPMSPSCGGAGA